MLINVSAAETERILALGFPIVDSLKTLGITIDKNLEFLETIHEKTADKIDRTITFWSRFNLSLIGRINIAKTFLLSNLSYIAQIITPTDGQFNRMELSIAKFIRGTLIISKDRIFKSDVNGGIGFPDLRSFVIALQCSWIKKSYTVVSDNWRQDLYRLARGNVLTLSTADINVRTNPIIYGIAASWEKFLKKFYTEEMNYKKMYILNSPVLPVDRRGEKPNIGLFRQENRIPDRVVANIRFSDVIRNDNTVVPLQELNGTIGFELSPAVYMKLMLMCTGYARTQRGRAEGKCETIDRFFLSIKKGSKKFRQLLEKGNITDLARSPILIKFQELHNVDLTESVKAHTTAWNKNYMSNRDREFIFKLTTNTLPVNNRLANYRPVDKGCAFCSIEFFRPVAMETTLHLFFECDTVQSWIEGFIVTYYPHLRNTLKTKNFWFGEMSLDIEKNEYLQMQRWAFLSTVWEFKIKHRKPSWLTFNEFYAEKIKGNLKKSGVLEIKKLILDNLLFRYRHGGREQ